MAQLLVRNLEPEVVKKLRQKAASDGISMEEEHRRILRHSLLEKKTKPKMSFKEYLLTMPDVGDGSIFARPKSKMRKSPF
jgi:antitoxin FitA